MTERTPERTTHPGYGKRRVAPTRHARSPRYNALNELSALDEVLRRLGWRVEAGTVGAGGV